jgi:class 3 adenylate cyclase
MQCQQCAADNPAHNNFCGACGVRLKIACAHCGHIGRPAGIYCRQCGKARASPQKRQRARGEIKHATILFADTVDSTRLIAGLNAEQASDLLRPVVAAMAGAVRQFGGTVDRNLGDGLKASFGAPSALEGHAVLACKAALAIQQSIASLPGSTSVRIGLHSGEVITGELDTGSAIEPETTGVTVHLASRIEELAEPGDILLSAECGRLVQAWFEMAPLGPQEIKGFDKPVEVYRLTGERTAVSIRQPQWDMLSPLMGRAEELGLLQRALAVAGGGEACAIGISASPGIGKSRLCYEFAERCSRQGIRVLEARASVYGYAAPLQPVLEMLRSFLGVSAVDEPANVRRKIADRLLGIDASFEADLPFLNAFLSAADPSKPNPQYDPQASQARLRTIINRIVTSEGRIPSVIIIEDLHWLDAASESLFETLVDAIVGTRILLVMNFRPTFKAGWMTRAHYKPLTLSELSVSDIRTLVRDLVGDGPDLRAISEQVADRSGGNPFFAEELVRGLSEDGTLIGTRGHYRRDTKSGGGKRSLPATLEAVIGARIDRLPEADKILLQISATIGREFPLEILKKVAEMPPRQIDASLARMSDASLIQASKTISGPGFAFRHPLIQEVGYAMQLRSRRTALHAAVAEAIAQCDWGQLDEFAGLLAHHFESAGQTAKAAQHLYRSATWIGRTNAEEAFRQWKKTVQLLASQAGRQEADKMRALASVAVLRFGFKVGISVEESTPYAEEALRYARKFAATEEGQQVLVQYGRFQASIGSADAYAAFTEEALAKPAPDAGRIAIHQGCLAQAYWMSGFLLKAEAASNAALETLSIRRAKGVNTIVGLDAPPHTGFDVELWIKCNKSRILVWLCRFDQAKLLVNEVFEAKGTERETPIEQSIAHLASVELACHHQDYAAANWHAGQVKRYARRAEIPYLRVYASYATALAQTASGDFVGSAHDLQAGLSLVAQTNAGHDHEPFMLAELSYSQYRGGMVEAAAVAQSAIAIARHRHRRAAECLATMVYAAATAQGNSAVANRKSIEAFERGEELIRLTGAALLTPRLEALRSESTICAQERDP